MFAYGPRQITCLYRIDYVLSFPDETAPESCMSRVPVTHLRLTLALCEQVAKLGKPDSGLL